MSTHAPQVLAPLTPNSSMRVLKHNHDDWDQSWEDKKCAALPKRCE
jgi:hypothetical protein